MSEVLCCFLFFFQAEDGIRDTSVTGVQTCALPICPHGVLELQHPEGQPAARGSGNAPAAAAVRAAFRAPGMGSAAADVRSEERRVGKECGSTWSACH